MIGKKTHESTKLNNLLGKWFRVVMWDDSVQTGVLGKSEYSARYKIDRPYKGSLHFYKSHIKKIEEVTK